MNFETIYRQNAKIVFNLALQYVQNKEDAEEITQDVFVAVHGKLETFRAEAEMSTWIYRIAINKSLDYLKAKKRKKRLGFFISIFSKEGSEEINLPPQWNHPGVEMEDQEELKALFAQINQLPDQQKTALILSKIEDKSYTEVGAILSISPKAVESLVQRAKANLNKIRNQARDNQF